MIKRSVPLFFILCLLSFAYTLPVYNKYWAPFDEGIIVVAAQRLLAGEVPYKDFFIVMYPPGQVYVLAFLQKLFPAFLTAGRIYAAGISVGISLLVFYITFMLTQRFGISLFSWFVVLISLSPRLGAIPAPIWPGMFLSLLALYIYLRYLHNPRYSYIIFAGITAGLAVIFRHDIGIFLLFSILGSLFIKLLYDKGSVRDMALFIGGALSIVFPVTMYFMTKSASQDMLTSLLIFPAIHKKTASIPFPAPSLDLNMIFHKSLYFIEVNQYYIPVLIYISMFTYLLNQLFRRRLHPGLLVIFLFGVFTYNQVLTRPDPPHLFTVIQPAVILFGVMMHRTLSHKFSLKVGILSRYAVTALILALFSLASIKNIDKYIKNTFRKVYKKDIIKTQFDVGTIYIPKEEREDVLNTINFIKMNTLPTERIYIGNIAHWKDDFAGSLILYTLAGRMPSTKYYEILPGLITQRKVQEEIKESLSRSEVNFIILQDIDLRNQKAPSPAEDRMILDNYIRENFRPVKKFGKYNIYEKE